MNLTQKFLQLALGGAEWVLWLLLLLSVFSVYVMIERYSFLRMAAHADARDRARLLAALDSGDIDGARDLARGGRGPGARMIAELLAHNGNGNGAAAAALDGARPTEKLRLERHLSFLGTLGANAPFVGLFGTVLGIIKAFKELAESGLTAGGDNTAAVMAGISEALVATAVGLLVAIPAVVAYNYLLRRVKHLLAEAEAMVNVAQASLARGRGA